MLAIKEIAVSNDFSNIKGITYRQNNKIARNEDRPFLEDLDELPVPARHLVNNKLYTRPDTQEAMAVIETNRGCPASCVFCLVGQVSGKKIRARSIESIVDEIEDCLSRYKINNFHFKSDTFTWNKSWVIDLCEEILRRKLKIKWLCNSRVDTLDRERLSWMKKAGCWAVGLGIESGNQGILNKIKKSITLEQSRQAVKLCREFRIKTYAYFMIGFPWDSEATINDSIMFAVDLNADFVDFFLPYPFPGTELEKLSRAYKLLKEDTGGRAYSQAIMDTLYVSRERLLRFRKEALKKFYFRPRYILKTLFQSSSPWGFCNYLYYGIKTLRKII